MAAARPTTISRAMDGMASPDIAASTPLRARPSAKSAARPMKEFAVFAAEVATMKPRRSRSYPTAASRRPFAVAFESPGSQPTRRPANVPRREWRASTAVGIEIPENRCSGTGPCAAVSRTGRPKSPERRGRKIASPPSGCQARNPYRRAKRPSAPETAKMANAHHGESSERIM